MVLSLQHKFFLNCNDLCSLAETKCSISLLNHKEILPFDFAEQYGEAIIYDVVGSDD